MSERVFRIDKGGTITALYTDDLRDIGGTLSVQRASDVEFDHEQQGWIADVKGDYRKPCTCSSNPPCARERTKLGPFRTREEALAAEIAFIQARL